MEAVASDLPFKLDHATIVIIKQVPLRQCKNCREFALDDPVMEKVEFLLNRVDQTAELEIFKYAA
jgi:YgiT-type zinc finger domain-containing protein